MKEMKKVRLCSFCKVGVPHWITTGHGSDCVKCENCGRTVEVPYDCRDYWDRWNKENEDGTLVEYTDEMGHRYVTSIAQLLPDGDFQRKTVDRLRDLGLAIMRLESTVEHFNSKLNMMERNYAVIRCDEPLTDITMGQYDTAVKVSNAVQELVHKYRNVLPGEMEMELMGILGGNDMDRFKEVEEEKKEDEI